MSVLESLVKKIIIHYEKFYGAIKENPLNISERRDRPLKQPRAVHDEEEQELVLLQKENEFSRALVLFVQLNKYCFLFANFDDFSRSIRGVHDKVLNDRRSVDAFLDCCYRLLLQSFSFNFAVLQTLYFVLTGSATAPTRFTEALNTRLDIFHVAFGQLPCQKVGQEALLFSNALLDLLVACNENKHICLLPKVINEDGISLLAKAVQPERHSELESLRER